MDSTHYEVSIPTTDAAATSSELVIRVHDSAATYVPREPTTPRSKPDPVKKKAARKRSQASRRRNR